LGLGHQGSESSHQSTSEARLLGVCEFNVLKLIPERLYSGNH